MKEYPSIPRDFEEFQAHVFDKLDGSNIRVEYSKKQGWYKFGKRHGLVDASDLLLGSSIQIFKNDWEERLLKKAHDERWQNAILFFEFFGAKSFAGWHEADDPKQLVLIDAALEKRGMLAAKDFLKTFKDENHAPYLGVQNWTRGFVERVWNQEIDGVSFEGVVGKGGERHKMIMRKAKTKQWIEKVRAKFTAEEAEKIINS